MVGLGRDTVRLAWGVVPFLFYRRDAAAAGFQQRWIFLILANQHKVK
jgi:hypothetical protein